MISLHATAANSKFPITSVFIMENPISKFKQSSHLKTGWANTTSVSG